MTAELRNELIADGTILLSCGLGMSIRNILLGLSERGFKIRINGPFDASHERRIPSAQWERLLKLKDTVVSEKAPLLVRGPIGFSSLPRAIRRNGPDRYTIFYTVTEVEELNGAIRAEAAHADEIWVPTDFDLPKFQEIHHRAFKINYFTDTRVYHPAVTPDPELKSRCRGFVFLFSGSGVYRKGLREACRAYLEAFTDQDDVTLVVLNKETSLETLFAGSEVLKKPSRPHVVWIPRYLHESEVPTAYACADVLLLPSRGEGWSHPAMEFACMGKPVIMTRYGGPLEFLDPEDTWLVEPDGFDRDPNMEKLSTAQYKGAKFPILGEGFMFRLSDAMRQACRDRALVKARGERLHRTVTGRFTPANTLDAIAARLRAIEADVDAGRVPPNPAQPGQTKPVQEMTDAPARFGFYAKTANKSITLLPP